MDTTRQIILDALTEAEVHATVDGHPGTIIGVGGAEGRRSTHAIIRHPDGAVRLYKHADVLLEKVAA